MADATDPGVTAPPAEPAAPAAPVSSEPPTGSEPVTNSDGKPMPDNQVPFERFQKANDTAKAAEERAAKLEQELEEARKSTPPPATDEVDPDVVDLVQKSAKKLGFVTQEELQAERNLFQVQQDVNDLTANPPVPGIPYDNKAVMEYAKENNLPLTSKAALRAAYRDMNYDKIVEAERQKAIDGFKTASRSGAELPGSAGAQPPAEPELTSKDPKGRTSERIRLARQKLAI